MLAYFISKPALLRKFRKLVLLSLKKDMYVYIIFIIDNLEKKSTKIFKTKIIKLI